MSSSLSQSASVVLPTQSFFAQQPSQIYYVDVNANYNPTDPTSSISLYNFDAITQFVSNVLLTPIGSRYFEPTFGSDIPDLIFSPVPIPPAMFERKFLNNAWTAFKTWLPMLTLNTGASKVAVFPELEQIVVRLHITLNNPPIFGLVSFNFHPQLVG